MVIKHCVKLQIKPFFSIYKYIFTGILLEHNLLFYPHYQFVIKIIFWYCSKTNIPHVIVEISRSLSIVSKHLSLIPTESIENVFVTGLSYIISHIEHFVDSVKVYVKMFLKELVLTAAKHKELGKH